MKDWAAAGFSEPARRLEATGEEILYRVRGGSLAEMSGALFSPIRLDAVPDEELRRNAAWWNGRCWYVATYRVRPGVPLWVGRIGSAAEAGAEPGDPSGIRVWVERPFGSVEVVEDVAALREALTVVEGAGRR